MKQNTDILCDSVESCFQQIRREENGIYETYKKFPKITNGRTLHINGRKVFSRQKLLFETFLWNINQTCWLARRLTWLHKATIGPSASRINYWADILSIGQGQTVFYFRNRNLKLMLRTKRNNLTDERENGGEGMMLIWPNGWLTTPKARD